MKIKKDDFLEALNAVKPAALKEGIDAEIEAEVTCFAFLGDKVIASGDTIFITSSLETDFKDICLPADKLYKVVNLLQAEELFLDYNEEKNQVLVKSLRNRIRIATIKADYIFETYERLNIDSIENKMKLLPKDFVEAIKSCLFSVSKQGELFTQSIYVDKKYIRSSDKIRITRYQMNKAISDSFLISSNAAQILTTYNLKKYYLAQEKVYFEDSNGTILCLSTVNEKFPNLDKHFKFDGQEVKLPSSIDNMIDLSNLFADGESDIDKSIRVEISKDRINILGSNDSGIGRNTSRIKYKGKDITFVINPIYLKEAIKTTKIIKIGEDRIAVSSNKFNHVVALFGE